MPTISNKLKYIRIFCCLFAVCSKPADVGILLDASGSIGRKRWIKVVEFTKTLVDAFNVSSKGSHIAILLYATKTKIEVAFDSFQGSEWNAKNIKDKLDAVDYNDWKGLTYIDRGIKKASDELFQYNRGLRRDKDIEKVRHGVTIVVRGLTNKNYIPAKNSYRNRDSMRFNIVCLFSFDFLILYELCILSSILQV